MTEDQLEVRSSDTPTEAGADDCRAQKLRETVASFAQREIAPIAAEVDRKNEFPMEMWEKLGEMGLLGVTVKEDDGGLGKGCGFDDFLSLRYAVRLTHLASTAILTT